LVLLKKIRLTSAQGSVVSKNGQKKGCKNSGALNHQRRAFADTI
jgi:hypothetical protein